MKRIVTLIAAAILLGASYPKPQTWLAIGDSITYLNDHLNETGNRVKEGYLTRVTEALPEVTYINKGYNGWTSGGIAHYIDSLGLVKADIYSVFLGTNDWWQGRPVGRLTDYTGNKGNTSLYGSFRIIIDKIRGLNPVAKIVLVTPLQRADFVYINDPKNNAYGSYKPKNGQYLEAFADAIDSIARYEDIPVVDLYHEPSVTMGSLIKFKRLKDPRTGVYTDYTYPAYKDVPFDPVKDAYPYPETAVNLTFDGLHPSDKGNALIAARLVKIFKQ
jgi:lysophospholipase L1-like esterase